MPDHPYRLSYNTLTWADNDPDLERVFATDLSNATQLTTAEWERRGTVAKLTERLLAPLRPLL